MVALDAQDAAVHPELERLRLRAEAWLSERRGGPELIEDLSERSGAMGASGTAGDAITLTYLARLGQSPAGFLTATSSPQGGRARLDALFVCPELRSIGIGHELLRHLLEELRRRGCDRLDGFALPGDRATKNFFESHAMVTRALVLSTRLDDGGSGDDDPV